MADSFKPVRLASVGVGLWGTALAEAAVASGRVHLESCYAPSPAKSQAFADRFQCRAASSFQALLDDDAVEGLLLATPNAMHHTQIEAAAAYGKHVLVEKPLALTLADALAATRSSVENGIILAVGHQYRRQAAIRKLKQLLEANAAGTVIGVEANISTSKALQISDNNWRWSADECPGGPLIQIGIHFVDILNYLFGHVAYVSSLQRHRVTQADIDDATVTVMEHESGVLSTLVSHYVTSRVASLRVSGTQAIITYDALMGLTIRHDDPDRARIEFLPTNSNQPLVDQLMEFATCIRENHAPEVGGTEGAHALAVVLAAVQSNQTGRSVRLAEMYQHALKENPKP